MAKLFLIPTEHAEAVWPLAEEFIDAAVEHAQGLLSSDELRDGVLTGRQQLWVAFDTKCRGAGVTEIINNHTCFIWVFGGWNTLKECPQYMRQVEAWARDNGCEAVQFFGRQGWEVAMRDEGYKRRMVVMRKELQP